MAFLLKTRFAWSAMALASLALAAAPAVPFSMNDMILVQSSLMGDRPNECPPCFNCLLPAHTCTQFADCNVSNGICDCPDGFGGDNCLEPLCASLPKGKDRPMRTGDRCECDNGWAGINCNVCTSNKACNASLPVEGGAVCYSGGNVIHQNFQTCDVTNKKIKDLLGDRSPQVTFTCSKEDSACDFQFWVDERESFYCQLSECESTAEFDSDKNSTSYWCDKIKCSCISDRMLCGENGSIDISDFLTNDIKGPGQFECSQRSGGLNHCAFKEPAMDDLILSLIGDSSILLTCDSGECLHESEVPGYERPIKPVNTPLIAGAIAGASIFLLAVILTTWFLSRRSSKYGPINLDEFDDEAVKLMTDHQPASLYFSNVSYVLDGKPILTGIHGVAHPGEVTAIIGASGAGKTTFLDILARKNKRGTVKGDLYVNGKLVLDADFKSAVGFVDQEDTMLPTLTVHETIRNSALLRLPRNMSRAAKEQRVHEVEKQLGIFHIRDSLIGSEDGKGRGVSGGEKRRVGIACELVTSPSVLFLDEPTSGLDAYNAYNVVECLVTLAKNYKRTVVFTIHQPRSNIVALFDRLILLAEGKLIYSGPFALCQPFFDRLGYVCPTGFNIADYLVDLTVHASTTALVDDATNLAANDISPGPSSTRAVKSISSDSAESTVRGSIGDQPLSRPSFTRNESVRFRQERELFTRKRPVPQPRMASTASNAGVNATSVAAPPSAIDDNHDLPSSNETATELDYIVRTFALSSITETVRDDIERAVSTAISANGHNVNNVAASDGLSAMGRAYRRIGYLEQFMLLSQRTWKNLYRNPMLMLTHYAIAIALAVLSGYLFYGLSDDISGFQNRLGLFFFLLALFGFSTLTSLNVFATERLLFVRERANGYYSPVTYFAAKVLFDVVPLRVIPPLIMGTIIYPMAQLVVVPEKSPFLVFLIVLVLFNLAASSICLFIGIVFKDSSVANLVGSLVMLFSLLFAGLLLNHNTIPKAALWLQSLSIFHYAFEALIVNEVVELTLADVQFGYEIKLPGATILTSFGFNNGAMGHDILSLCIVAGVFILLSYAAMHVFLVEKR